MVWPTVATAVVVLLTMLRLALEFTTKVALAGLKFEPTDVTSDPAGKMLSGKPLVALVTTTDTEQLAPGGMPVLAGTNKLGAVAVASTGVLAIQVLLIVEGAALVNPAGYASIKLDVNVAVVREWVLVKVITKSEVPPATIAEGANDLETVGRLGVTVSVSGAVHTPETEQALVLVTLGGTVIEAVLVINV